MNKTKTLLIAAMLTAAALVQAKDYHLVVKPSTGKPPGFGGNTEVFIGGITQRDTITIHPADNVTEIHLSIKTLAGEVIFSRGIPFDLPEQFNIITPHMPEGFLLEIKDNNGVIYTSIEEEE
ncbi:MAG: hypothetical protein IJK43_10205 [Prevotella sp.]|nr:hypothetical protein [Prevotella sp.]